MARAQVLRYTSAPASRAAFAKAWVTPAGSTWPSCLSNKAPTKYLGSIRGTNSTASATDTSSVCIPRYRPRAWVILSQSTRSGVSASITPPGMWMPQSWPDARSISAYSSVV